jgi:Mrp family chromosome partitioning ATPase/capsular polysaccharide biosynthesis protein
VLPIGFDASPRAASPELEAIVAGRGLVAATVVLSTVAAIGYVLLREPTFQSKVQLLVESGELQLFREEPVVVPAMIPPSVMETQVRLIGSRGIARSVVENLDLASDPEFTVSGPAQRLRRAIGLGIPERSDAAARRGRAAASFLQRLSVDGLGVSNVVEVGFTSSDPGKAALVANEIARVYQERLRQAADARARGASAWVLERVQTVGTHARVISEATASVFATGVRGALIVPAAAIAGLVIGVALAILRHLMRPMARSPEQFASLIAAEFLASVPRAAGGSAGVGTAVLDQPASAYARALHRVAAALQERRRDRASVLGIASPTPGEGATSFAVNLANLLALNDHRVILVDGNAGDPAITRGRGLTGATGLADVLMGTAYEEVIVASEPRSGLDILPIGRLALRAPPGGSAFHLPSVAALAARLRAAYDFVVIDLPALEQSADVRAAGPVLDGLLLVLDDRARSHGAIRDALGLAGRSRDRLIGFVLNHAGRPGPAAAAPE